MRILGRAILLGATALLWGCGPAPKKPGKPTAHPMMSSQVQLREALRYSAHQKSLQSLKSDLKHPFHEVRANALFELSRRGSRELAPDAAPLLDDPVVEVVANARWYFHEITGLPLQAEPEWSQRWIRHFLIDGLPPEPGWEENGIPVLTESERENTLGLSVEPPELFKEFGGACEVLVHLTNRTNAPMRVRVSFDGLYLQYRYTESGHEFVDEKGESWTSALRWNVTMRGLLDGREASTVYRVIPADDIFGEEIIAPGESTPLRLELKTPQTITVREEQRRWDYCEYEIQFVAESMLLQTGEDNLRWVSFESPAAIVRVFDRVVPASSLVKEETRKACFDRSDFSALKLVSLRLKDLPESVAANFMEECFDSLSATPNEAWSRFLFDILQSHLPVEIDVPEDAEGRRQALDQLRAWWERSRDDLKWSAETGRWDQQ